MNNDTLIVSMTSYPKRIGTTRDIYNIILGQKEDDVHFVLVLSEDEFPNLELDLPKDLRENFGVEIIWDKGNIRSHKKLIPTLERYPDNAILVVDDDMTMRPGWLHEFIEMHKKYPEDIIYGQTSSVVITERDGSLREIRNFDNTYLRGVATINQKPANGAAGTLYPAHTFTSPLFFDREKFMALSPTSDETWQFLFCVLSGRRYRSLYENGICRYDIQTNQEDCLADVNKEKYTEIHNILAAHFPQYKEKLQERLPGVVVSMATYGERMNNSMTAILSILRQTMRPEKFILNIPVDDVKNMSQELLDLVKVGDIEVHQVIDDMGPHNKWIYAATEYYDRCILLVDDDVEYENTMIQRMFTWWQRNPGCVISSRCRWISMNIDGSIKPYGEWPVFHGAQGVATRSFLPTGCGGTFIPPYILEDAIDYDMIKDFALDDDLYLKLIFNKHYANVLFVNVEKHDIYVGGKQLSCDMNKKIERIQGILDKYDIMAGAHIL